MARATGNDLCEIFGYAPDDTSAAARKQCKSQLCPFVGNTCIKHSHEQADGAVVVYGSCSVKNVSRNKAVEEVIICPQRLYSGKYDVLRACVRDAFGSAIPVLLADEYSVAKSSGRVPRDCIVMLGQNCGKEIVVSKAEVGKVSLDWVFVRVMAGKVKMFVPTEVQSIDVTNNYYANWRAYMNEQSTIPDSAHGMNWANVWKRLIPQIIMKGAIASTSTMTSKGMYFVAPEAVYRRFERLVGNPPPQPRTAKGVLTVMTYALGPAVAPGKIRRLQHVRTVRTLVTDFASAFASGGQLLPLGTVLDEKVISAIKAL
jgi:Restriction endonuclease NotI